MIREKTLPFVSGDLPIIGHALQFRNDMNGLLRRGQAEHGDMFAIKLAKQKVAVVSGADANKYFYSETDKSLNITDVYGFLKEVVGEVLFVAPHDVYMNQRPILQAIFSREKMAKYIVDMQVEVQRWLDRLGDEGEMEIAEEMLQLTQYVAGRAFIGPNFREELGENFWEDYTIISRSIEMVLPADLPLPKYVQRDKARERIGQTLKPLIARRRNNPDRYDDLITQLLTQPQKDGTPMADDDIITLFVGLLFAGHETTAGQAAWTLIQLIQHPAYLQHVVEEANEHIDLDEDFSGKTLRQLKHTYWAVDETSRLHPSAPMQMRIVEEPLEMNGYTIPAGWLIMVNSTITHFQHETFVNPHVYDPFRYSPERREGKNSFNIVSFGGGIHKCTGMNFAKNEMAIIAALFFKQFDVELLTARVKTIAGAGASRPSPTILRYKRKAAVAPEPELSAAAV